ncbi:ExeM/NucH family extracellular endonuclease [Glaciihabitans sp. dw_435]|uniref:ExeM/NucH family extracellular endonuclease n=1 Tax=Glaciihabitans sp. dw_435 TaxID=2720081 RepID=UPI001BD67CF7|nr:ExeM/NucH family extracellular endonuclease [Glaciihabitans sp. dw_435]
MSNSQRTRSKAGLAGILGVALAIAPLGMLPAQANTAGTGVVINEIHPYGGTGGTTYSRFVELYNPTDAAISLESMSLQYRPAAGIVNPTSTFKLSGSIAPKGHFLVSGTGATGSTLPTPDLATTLAAGGAGGTLFLANQIAPLTAPAAGGVVTDPAILDEVGWGTSNTYETKAVTGGSVTLSYARTSGTDTDDNSADFTAVAPTPQNAASDAPPTSTPTATPTGTATPTESPTPTVTPSSTPTPSATPTSTPTAAPTVTIAAIQGTTDTSPLAGTTVVTRGIVTASYPTGGFSGYTIQTPGTGGAVNLTTHTASDGLFVFSSATVGAATIGDYVEVTGAVSEYQGLTELSVAAGGLKVLTDTAAAVTPVSTEIPLAAAQRESLESMVVKPTSAFTITDNYDTNYYGSIVLNPGTRPLNTPTAVVEPGSAAIALAAANVARVITLDDGSSLNFNSTANKGTPLPYLSTTNPVRIGAAVTFTKPVILDYRFSGWTFQPTQQLTTANAATVQPATFANTRTAKPDDVGGDVTLASFNVLNYFTTTGDTLTGCSYYTDRAGNPITVNTGCDARGAANATSLARQQAKIVAAINGLGADVVSLEEIENSARFGKPRDTALAALVDALNAAAGEGTWNYVASPATLPAAQEDVIRTAYIYKPAVVKTVGASVILDDPAFVNARAPLAQEFELATGTADSTFLAIVNHFKSKGSGEGDDADKGDGQGASNLSRVNQAKALVKFADTLKAERGTDRVLLGGDFNAYLKEDPIDVLTAAGYVDLGSQTGKQTYAFDGAVGSLDHIFASAGAAGNVHDVDVWNINSVESIALEYSRYNYNALDLYKADAYRSSDHDPILVGLEFGTPATVDLNLLNINDFHGRIDENTVKFAGTIESLKRAGGENNTLFLSDGDNIGASVFASSSQQDEPTIDVLNTLGLKASAVGNHEFDQGLDDLTGRVEDNADWSYLGANVYKKGTTEPALDEYDIFTVKGVRVAVIGAVTQETPSLVSPGGIATLDFGDPVVAVNRVVTQLKAANLADVFIAEYHEGASAGTPEKATLEQELALNNAFTNIVTKTSADVDAIFTGHTHKQYAWDAQVPGAAAGVTRPVLQTGNYGENIGQIVLTVDTATKDVTKYTAKNVARLTTADDALIADYPRVAQVDTITKAALAAAAIIGNKPVGSITKDITRASTSATAVSEDRGAESSLGNLVADSLVSTLSSEALGSAEIGVVNPGGLRADLTYKGSSVGEGDGVVTYAEANAVLPFVNNLWTTTLTGAQFKKVLEQQWQTNADGTVPSRPFLNLGLSKNVTYTYDATKPQDSHITSISVDGKPIDPAKTYRVGSFSFLLQGGDNFREFANGTNTRDSGLIDRDAWISYITAKSPISPSFDRRGVQVTDVPTAALVPGSLASVKLSKLDLTSLGSPANTLVTASFEGSTAAPTTSVVTAGASTVSFVVPTGLPESATLVIVAKESNTTVRVPLTIAPVAPAPVITGTTPVIAGVTQVGRTLTAVAGEWTPAGVTLSYQWMRNGSPIAKATSNRYMPVTADGGTAITVQVTGTLAGSEPLVKTSEAVVITRLFEVIPIPTLTGSHNVGAILTAHPGTWKPSGATLTYQWTRNGVAIPKQTVSMYRTTPEDIGQVIRVTVTGSKEGYLTQARTSAGVQVLQLFTATPAPKIAGVAKVGRTLNAVVTRWTPSAGVSYHYQWKRNGASIAGATGARYKLTTKDKGKSITLVVTGTKTNYIPAAKSSARVVVK